MWHLSRRARPKCVSLNMAADNEGCSGGTGGVAGSRQHPARYGAMGVDRISLSYVCAGAIRSDWWSAGRYAQVTEGQLRVGRPSSARVLGCAWRWSRGEVCAEAEAEAGVAPTT